MTENYRTALSETWCIIEQYSDEDKKRIPEKIKRYIRDNRNQDYNPNFDVNVHLKDLELRPETKGLLALIYQSYFCNEQEKIEFELLLKENARKKQEELSRKYDINKTFEDNYQRSISSEENIVEENTINNITNEKEETQLTTYQEAPWYKKLFTKIKNLFRRNK